MGSRLALSVSSYHPSDLRRREAFQDPQENDSIIGRHTSLCGLAQRQ